MSNEIIKDFVKRQTSGVTIGVPKSRPKTEETAQQAVTEAAPAAHEETNTKVRGQVGRPKSLIDKVKISVYVPAEVKEKLIKIQHNNYKQNLNDVMTEAIDCLLTKYGEK